MKKILFLLILFLALPLQAQEYTSRYFHYNQYFDAPAPFTLTATTIDGADNNSWSWCAGGACTAARGASISAAGNDVGGAGAGGGLTYEAGTGALANHYFQTAGLLDWTLGANITQNATNGNNIIMSKASTYQIMGTAAALNADVTIPANTSTIYASSVLSGNVIQIYRYGAADAYGAGLTFYKTASVSNTLDANTALSNNDTIGFIKFAASSGTTYRDVAAIKGYVNGVIGSASDTPGALTFATSSDGASSVIDRWSILQNGDIYQESTNGGDVVFAKVGKDVVHTRTTKTAVGSTQADAVALTAVHFTLVAGADATTGAKLPAYASYTIGQEIKVHNNAAAALKLYSNAAGDLINDVAGTTAYSVAAHKTADCFLYDATHMYCSN